MSVNIIFRIAAVGILVTILVQVLKHSGRDEQAFLITFHDIMYQGRNVHLEIEIPKGYKGCLYIKDVATEKYKNQEEVLFKRGFQYKIKSVNKEKDRYYIKAEAVL